MYRRSLIKAFAAALVGAVGGKWWPKSDLVLGPDEFRQSAMIDLGGNSHRVRYHAAVEFASTPDLGELVEFYIAPKWTLPDADLKNLQYLGCGVVDDQTRACNLSGVFEVPGGQFQLIVASKRPVEAEVKVEEIEIELGQYFGPTPID